MAAPLETSESTLFPPKGFLTCEPVALSADGSTLIGNAVFGDTKREAFRWTAQGVELLTPPFEFRRTEAVAVSADGLVVLGNALGDGVLGVIRWTGTGRGELPLRPPLGVKTSAVALSADGRVFAFNKREIEESAHPFFV